MNGRVADTLIRGMNQPQQAVMVNIFMPCELMHAMGLTPMFPEGLSVYVACTACQHVFAERAETSGIPESFCSYHKTMIGMAESGVLPKPLLIAGTTLACDANQLSFRHLAAHYPAPLTLIDVPAREDDAAVACVADQLRELARTLETLTGRKLDEAKLRESMACANRTLALMREYADLRAEVSQDTTMTGRTVQPDCDTLPAWACGWGKLRPRTDRNGQTRAQAGNDAPQAHFLHPYPAQLAGFHDPHAGNGEPLRAGRLRHHFRFAYAARPGQAL